MQEKEESLAAPGSPAELFTAFTVLALQGFGGVLAIAQRVLCDQKLWLTREQFVELLAIGQVLPGPNICNISLMVGDRFFGWRGAFAALAGMMVIPLVIVLALTALYVQYEHQPAVAGALRGMGAVAAGMIFGTALRLAPALRTNPMGVTACVLFGAVAFVAVAWLRVPLVWMLPGLGVPAMLYAAWRLARRSPV